MEIFVFTVESDMDTVEVSAFTTEEGARRALNARIGKEFLMLANEFKNGDESASECMNEMLVDTMEFDRAKYEGDERYTLWIGDMCYKITRCKVEV